MKKYIYFSILLGLILGFHSVNAQPIEKNSRIGYINYPAFETPTLEKVSLEEMKEGFNLAFERKREPLRLNNDRSAFRTAWIVSPLKYCPLLKESEKYRGIWIFVDQEKDSYLSLYKLKGKEAKDTLAAQLVFEKMKKKYGATKNGVIFPWFSGVIPRLSDPVPYMNHIVSPWFNFMRVEKGKILNTKSWDFERTYADEAGDLQVANDGHWLRHVNYEMIYLTHDINRIWWNKGVRADTSMVRHHFSALLYIGTDGKLTLHTLRPLQPTSEEQLLLKELQLAVGQLSPWCFGYLYTLDARIFPGRYVSVSYYGGRNEWVFLDYLKRVKLRLSAENDMYWWGEEW